MRLKHFEYSRLVTEAYKKKLVKGELSPLLAQSTPGNIRLECAHVYEEHFDKKDEPMLRAWFGPGEQGRKFLNVIKGFDVNKFKPLDKFFKSNGAERINDRNLELLAWLIGFEHRPFNRDKDVVLTAAEMALLQEEAIGEDFAEPAESHAEKEKEEEAVLQQEGEDPGQRPAPVPDVEREDHIKKAPIYTMVKRIVAAAILLVFGGTGAYMIISKPGGCMYWTGDHYERIACDENPNGRFIIPMDNKQFGVQRILQEDTIREQHIGRLYYIKNEKDYQYFTQDGKFPEDLDRDLQKLSRNIFDKDSINRLAK